MIHPPRLAAGVTGGSALASLLGERTTHDVRVGIRVDVEEWETHEQDQDNRARKGEWQMVEKHAAAMVAVRTKRLNRR